MGLFTDGFTTTISFTNDKRVLFGEKTVTPMGMDTGGPIDVTTMRNNVTWRTMVAKQLITSTEVSASLMWDYKMYNAYINALRKNQIVIVFLPQLFSFYSFWGYLDKFKPGPHKEGEHPVAEATVVVTNLNTLGFESGPIFAGPA